MSAMGRKLPLTGEPSPHEIEDDATNHDQQPHNQRNYRDINNGRAQSKERNNRSTQHEPSGLNQLMPSGLPSSFTDHGKQLPPSR